MFGLGRKPPKTAIEQLRLGKWRCKTCATEHGWPFDLAARTPDPWPHGEEYEENTALRLDGDFLSEDFCVLGGKYFMVRAVLPIPVNGVDDDFGFGCWSTLSRTNFDKYVDGFDVGEYADMSPWSGWLMNQLGTFVEGTDPIALWVQPRADRQRPLLWVQDDQHPLAIAQDQGITPARVLEIFRFYGHAPD